MLPALSDSAGLSTGGGDVLLASQLIVDSSQVSHELYRRGFRPFAYVASPQIEDQALGLRLVAARDLWYESDAINLFGRMARALLPGAQLPFAFVEFQSGGQALVLIAEMYPMWSADSGSWRRKPVAPPPLRPVVQ